MSKNPRGRGAQSDYVQTSRRRQPSNSNYSEVGNESDYRNEDRYSDDRDYETRQRGQVGRYGREYNDPDFYNESRSSIGYDAEYENWQPEEYPESDYYGRNPSGYRNYGMENEFTPYRSSRDSGNRYYGNPGFGSLRQSFDDRYRGQSNPYREFNTENYRRSDHNRFYDRDVWSQGNSWQEGQFRGKGPKGYTRSDDRILEDISDMLTDDSTIDASEIEVRVDNGDVTLTGTVDSKRNKRRAEDLVESVSGVRNIENMLRVKKSIESGQEFGSQKPMSDRSKKSQTAQTLN